MAERRSSRARRSRASLPAQAVMKAFRSAKSTAPQFMSTCGIFPEVSESASDRLHDIVNSLAMRQLNKGRHLRALHRRIEKLTSAGKGKQSAAEIADGFNTDLTAVLASEAIAAYLFGLSVGMTVRTLPERLDR